MWQALEIKVRQLEIENAALWEENKDLKEWYAVQIIDDIQKEEMKWAEGKQIFECLEDLVS